MVRGHRLGTGGLASMFGALASEGYESGDIEIWKLVGQEKHGEGACFQGERVFE